MPPLRVSLIQGATRWHDPAGNREYYAQLLAPLRGQTDLCVLPETFTSGFSNEAIHNAETMEGPTLDWIRTQAQARSTPPSPAACNCAWARAIRKKYTTACCSRRRTATSAITTSATCSAMRANTSVTPGGAERLIVEWKGWRIFPLVCYDLRFPVWSRNRVDASTKRFDYDLVLFVANWPSARSYAWRTLLRARAIENLSYCAGLNRVGIDGNNLHYGGDSAVLDFLGQPLIELGAQEQVATVTLAHDALTAHRERFPAWMDADEFRLGD